MKSLRSILGAQLVLGCLAAMAVILAVRTASYHGEAVERTQLGVAAAMEDVAWEIARQRRATLEGAVLLAEHLELPGEAAEDPTAELSSRHLPSTVAFRFEGTGECQLVHGQPPVDAAHLEEAIRSASVAGVRGPDGPSSAVVVVDGLPLVVAAASGSDAEGARTALVRPLELRIVRSLHPGVQVRFHDFEGNPPPSPYEGALAELQQPGGCVAVLEHGGSLELRAFADGAGRPALAVAASQFQSLEASFSAVVGGQLVYQLLLVGISVLIALRFLLRSVIRPLAQLQGQAARLTASAKVKSRFSSGDAAEIRRLGVALDGMIDKVEVDRNEIVRDARRAGMSDVSMGVVHAAGNILNSINVSTKLLLRDVKGVDVNDMHSLARELEEHSDDLATYVAENENGRFLIPFIIAMADAVGELRSRCIVELESLDQGLGQVIDLIRSQEKYAVGPAMVEEVALSDVVERALEIASISVDHVEKVHVERQFEGVPLLRTDPHRLTSALINIIVNAFEALESDDLEERRLALRIYATEDRRVVVEVSDTGVGIDPEDLDLIFTSSFSSKHGHSGEGLHMAANVCQELGVAIGVMSEGKGTGCSIKLRVPTAKAASAVAEAGASAVEAAPTGG
ncbi:MAG: HAMP domain-containing sensor histidine kinase [Planctomycetota bacterium]|jgi:signal transduction histidine kinase